MKVTFSLKEEDIKRLIARQLKNDGYETESIIFKMTQREYNSDPELETFIILDIQGGFIDEGRVEGEKED